MGDGEAHRHALALGADHPAGRRAVPVDGRPARSSSGNRAAIDHIGDMADQCRIENLVDRLVIVAAALVGRVLTLLTGVTPKASGVFSRWNGCEYPCGR